MNSLKTKRQCSNMDIESRLLLSLRNLVLEFVNDLKFVFKKPEDQADLMLMDFFFSHLSSEKIFFHFEKYVLKHREYIKRKDDAFFDINRKDIFKGLPDERVNDITAAWMNGEIPREDKETIWSYFSALIEICEMMKTIRKNGKQE